MNLGEDAIPSKWDGAQHRLVRERHSQSWL